jgi:hypothetical protein
VDGEIIHLIVLRGEMELEFAKMQKNKVNFVFILEFFKKLLNLSWECQQNFI